MEMCFLEKFSHIALQSSLIFNLRSKCQKEFKENFHNQNGISMCPLCDTQEHALACRVVAQELGGKSKWSEERQFIRTLGRTNPSE